MSASLLAHPLLSGCRRLFLRGHELPVRIGVHAVEQAAPQRLSIDVDLYVRLADSTPRDDLLDEVVDYDFIRAAIAARVAEGHIGLQETLCDAIASHMLAHPMVRAVRVATEKPDVYPDCAGVGVEVLHIKETTA